MSDERARQVQALKLLNKVFGFPAFRGAQQEIIGHLVAGSLRARGVGARVTQGQRIRLVDGRDRAYYPGHSA